jgi:hypothetical protein
MFTGSFSLRVVSVRGSCEAVPDAWDSGGCYIAGVQGVLEGQAFARRTRQVTAVFGCTESLSRQGLSA